MNTSVYIHISLVSNAGRNKITLHSWDFMWTRCLRDVTRCKDMAFWTSMSIQSALLWNSKSDLGDREDLMEIWKEIAVDWQLGSPSIGKQLDAAWVAQSDEPGTQSTAIVSTIFFWCCSGAPPNLGGVSDLCQHLSSFRNHNKACSNYWQRQLQTPKPAAVWQP